MKKDGLAFDGRWEGSIGGKKKYAYLDLYDVLFVGIKPHIWYVIFGCVL